MTSGWSCHSTHHRGPLILIGVGIGFSTVGAIPVAVNLSIGVSNSGTIIGVGFIGFGLLLMLPGICWCLIQRLISLKDICCNCKKSSVEIHDTTPALPSRSVRSSISNAHNNDCVYHVDNDDDDDNDEGKILEINCSSKTNVGLEIT